MQMGDGVLDPREVGGGRWWAELPARVCAKLVSLPVAQPVGRVAQYPVSEHPGESIAVQRVAKTKISPNVIYNQPLHSQPPGRLVDLLASKHDFGGIATGLRGGHQKPPLTRDRIQDVSLARGGELNDELNDRSRRPILANTPAKPPVPALQQRLEDFRDPDFTGQTYKGVDQVGMVGSKLLEGGHQDVAEVWVNPLEVRCGLDRM